MSQSRRTLRRPFAEEASILTSVPDIDRARAFAEQIAGSVNAGAWAFVRFDGEGNAIEIVVPDEDVEDAPLIDWLQSEREIQGERMAAIPRVTRTAVSTSTFRSGLTVVYGRDEAITGLLLLLRIKDQAPFSSADMTFLQATLESGSAVLDRLRVFDGEQTAKERAKQRTLPAQFVLREDFSIEYGWMPPVEAGDEVVGTLLSTVTDRFPEAIENAIRSIVAKWTGESPDNFVGVAIPLPFLLVRAVRLLGENERRIGVQVERFRARNAMGWASSQFHMSPRELQIMALILQGFGTDEMADVLHIAGSTAHDHIKRMLLKTKSRNRVEMVAKVLGWRAVG